MRDPFYDDMSDMSPEMPCRGRIANRLAIGFVLFATIVLMGIVCVILGDMYNGHKHHPTRQPSCPGLQIQTSVYI
jgi:hypothetical protein